MDLALESLKDVIVLLRSSEIGNSGAISAKLPPSTFECDCFQIAADLPNLAHVGAIFKAVLKAPQCWRERCLVFKTTSPQNYPSRTAALREQQLMAKIDDCIHGLGKKV